MRKVGTLALAFAILTGAAAPVVAQPGLALTVKAAVQADYARRLASADCAQYFRLRMVDVRNWVERARETQVEVRFTIEFLGDKTLYGNSSRARQCLGRNAGEGFFQTDTAYLSAGYVYTLSKWAEGWHIDRIELQP